MTDPIADMLTRIRNAQAVNKPEVVIPYSKIKMNLANIILREGYIQKAEKIDDGGRAIIKVTPKYLNEKGVIKELTRISKPGRRVYANKKSMPYVYDGLGVAIISTSKGLMTNIEARKKNLGGEIICEIF